MPSSSDGLLIYGASGFTGQLVVKEALARGLRPLLGGRDRAKVAAIARPNELESRAAGLGDALALKRLLQGVRVLLNTAGPFRMTALPLARACLESGVHYLDIGGEYATIEALASLHEEALAAGSMLLPGVGFDVVASDCMAAWVAERLPGATELRIGLTGLNAISRGSAETVLDQLGDGITVRRAGRLVRVGPGELTRDFDFGEGPRRATAVGWADVASAFYTTGIPNITVYYEETAIMRLGQQLTRYGGSLARAPGVRWLQGAAIRLMPPGPSAERRALGHATVVIQAENARGQQLQVRLQTPEVYSFSASTSIAIADRVLGGLCTPGFGTPGRVLGANYVESLPGVIRESVSERGS